MRFKDLPPSARYEARMNARREREKKWRVENDIKQSLEYRRKYNKEAKENLSDHYIKTLMADRSCVLSAEDIPQELIEIERVNIKLKRGIKDVKENHKNNRRSENSID